jgi:3-methyladenine DNA glycosylase Mpg
MQHFRSGVGLLDLARRTGRLARAMHINFEQRWSGSVFRGSALARDEPAENAIGESARIGLTRNVDSKPRYTSEAIRT